MAKNIQDEPKFKVGDVVETTYYGYKSLKVGTQVRVANVQQAPGAYYGGYENPDDRNNRGEYVYKYKTLLKFDGISNSFDQDNFKLVGAKVNPLQLETKKSTIVQEVKPSVEDPTSFEAIGEPVVFTSVSEARNFTTKAITESIRSKNDYRQFHIYTLDSVARAKEPEIEFA